ncbi:MAG: hypothetical protein KatS3mg027_0435 [Bacteroidia bacterium]|nr:MAG: hypothetical protein KatS3mg027_0435 [Bacteroidia bacterium]
MDLRIVTGGVDRIYVTSNGQVGIGTASPQEKLEVRGKGRFTDYSNAMKYLEVGYNGTNGMINFESDESDDALLINYFSGRDVVIGNISSGNLIANKDVQVNGKVGIGTSSPADKLHVKGNGIFEGIGETKLWAINGVLGYGFGIDANGVGHIWKDFNNPSSVMSFDGNGRVYVGDKKQVTGQHTDALFTVYGKGVFTRCIVTQVNWADYVFNENYSLKSIEEVEMYIKKHKHLPGIPDNKQIQAEGIDIGKISSLQMEKIEELYLYIIYLKKEIERLKSKINHEDEK